MCQFISFTFDCIPSQSKVLLMMSELDRAHINSKIQQKLSIEYKLVGVIGRKKNVL